MGIKVEKRRNDKVDIERDARHGDRRRSEDNYKTGKSMDESRCANKHHTMNADLEQQDDYAQCRSG